MRDKRVVFDFALQFSNGGGLQGQGFRLDIDGERLADEDLAAYLIEDLRLLMVSKVDILNKRIIDEQHKRKSGPENAGLAQSGASAVDLSHTIENGMVTKA
jgi:arylformamidase